MKKLDRLQLNRKLFINCDYKLDHAPKTTKQHEASMLIFLGKTDALQLLPGGTGWWLQRLQAISACEKRSEWTAAVALLYELLERQMEVL